MAGEPLDWDVLRAHCASDELLVAELIALFRDEVQGQLGDLAQAVAAGDARALKDAAHRLKGALVTLAAGPATAHAIALESCGARGDLGEAPSLLAQLEHEIARLLAATAAHAAN